MFKRKEEEGKEDMLWHSYHNPSGRNLEVMECLLIRIVLLIKIEGNGQSRNTINK